MALPTGTRFQIKQTDDTKFDVIEKQGAGNWVVVYTAKTYNDAVKWMMYYISPASIHYFDKDGNELAPAP